MGEIVSFDAEPAPGDFTFMQCPCDPQEPELMTPVVCHDAKGPFIAALMCPKCEARVSVEYGRINTDEAR